MLKTGVVLFDDPVTPGAAWACRAGESAFRIASTSALPNDTVWLLDMDMKTLYRFGLDGHAVLRDTSFLRTKLDVLMQELFDPRASRPEICRALADLFERQVRLFLRFIEKRGSRERWMAHPYSMRQAIREAILPMDSDFRGNEEVYQALSESLQEIVQCPVYVDESKGDAVVALILPRIAHTRQLLRCEVPIATKTKIITKGFPKTQEAQFDWVSQQACPMLLQVTVHSIESSMSSIVSYGAITPVRMRKQGLIGKSYRSARSWMTTPEFFWIAPIAKLELHQAILFESHQELQHSVIDDFFGAVTLADEAGISAGLFAENLWTGLVSSHADAIRKATSFNIIAPFVRAYERFICFQKVLQLAQEGYRIKRYGTGRIYVVLQNDEFLPANAFRAAALIGAIPPMIPKGYPHKIGMMDALSSHTDTAYLTLMNVIASGETGAWLDFDAELVEALVR